MRNFRLTIEYDGTDYSGWQIQSSSQTRKRGRVKTIQGILQDALLKLFSKSIKIASSSRTDSGVHAKGHVANFMVETRLGPLRAKEALNSLLPRDIIVTKAEVVKPGFNSQYDASSKTYRYIICNRDCVSPFIRRYVCHFRQPLDLSLMRKEARVLLGKHDFAAFMSYSPGRRKKTGNSVRAVKELRVRGNNGLIEIDIEADGFLYNMARNIVGTLLEIGRGRFTEGSMKTILRSRDRRKAGPTAPAKGLQLLKVRYF